MYVKRLEIRPTCDAGDNGLEIYADGVFWYDAPTWEFLIEVVGECVRQHEIDEVVLSMELFL